MSAVRLARLAFAVALPAMLLFSLAGTSPAMAASKARTSLQHGALAYHAESGRYGYAVDRASPREARKEALRQCDSPRCEVVLDFKDGCGALARGPRARIVSQGATRDEAQARAQRQCGAGCEIVVWGCTR